MKTYDKTPRLTPKQAAYVKGIAELKSKRQAALDAGYAPSVARCARACIEGPGVRELFQTIARCWIDPELVGQRIAEGLNAMETKSAQFEGRFTDHINVIDWSERRQYAELAARLAGYHVDKQEVEVKRDLTPADASKRLDELLARLAARVEEESKPGRADRTN